MRRDLEPQEGLEEEGQRGVCVCVCLGVPRTLYHTGGLMLAFADPRREPTLPPQVNPVSDSP